MSGKKRFYLRGNSYSHFLEAHHRFIVASVRLDHTKRGFISGGGGAWMDSMWGYRVITIIPPPYLCRLDICGSSDFFGSSLVVVVL